MQLHLKRLSKGSFILLLSLFTYPAYSSNQTSPEHCGVLEAFEGDVEILDSTRSDLLDVNPKAFIPCGAWVSVKQGWVHIQHSSGVQLAFSSQTFAQMPKMDLEKKDSDPLILFKGEAYISTENSFKKRTQEFSVVTPSARARIQSGKAIVIFDQEGDQTQLIALQKAASLENKFEPSRKVKVQVGESTELNFSVPRVIPSLPKVISASALRVRLSHLNIPDKIRNSLIRAAIQRKDRTLASTLTSHRKRSPKALTQKSRSYERIPASSVDSKLKKEWVKRIMGGDSDGENILNSGDDKTKRRFKGIEVIDPSDEFQKRRQFQEDAEKKRLMDELSRIELE